jgi:large conductance mechanosensitive channel
MAEQKKPKKAKHIVKPREVSINVPGIKVPRPFSGFVAFMRGNGVVGLAIGLFLGTSLKTILDAFTVSVVNPIIGVGLGSYNLSNLSICIQKSGAGTCSSKVSYGLVLSALISFIIAAFMVYLIVKLLRLDKFDQKNDK